MHEFLPGDLLHETRVGRYVKEFDITSGMMITQMMGATYLLLGVRVANERPLAMVWSSGGYLCYIVPTYLKVLR